MQTTKTCPVSGKNFEIPDEDHDFYKKMSLPAPTLCPEERWKRRMRWRNDRVFYQRKCDLTGRDIISQYRPEMPFPVYHQSVWWPMI